MAPARKKTPAKKVVVQVRAPRRRTRRSRSGQGLTSITRAPSAMGRNTTSISPQIVTRNGTTIVRNCESITTLTSAILIPGAEIVGNIPLSARNTTSLPWLERVGALYSKYRYRNLQVVYEPYCPTNTSGQLVMALVYDFNDTTTSPSSTTILQTGGNVRCSVWDHSQPLRYDVAKAAQPWYYSRLNPAANTQANLSVPAWLIYSIFSYSVDQGLGRIMCHYDVEFCDPVAPGINS